MQGQLGLGGTPNKGQTRVEEPEKVVFPGDTEDGKDNCFVFGITAAGWHTGALVLGNPNEDSGSASAKVNTEVAVEEEHTEEQQQQRGGMPGAFPLGGRLGNHPFIPPMFRVGFAGRGGILGGFARRGQGMRYGTGGSMGLSE